MTQPNLECRRAAITIGINQYKDNHNFERLQGAECDANEIAEILRSYGKFEINDDSSNLLIGTKATNENIRTAISNIFWNENPYNIVLFYFSGHGFVDGFNNTYIAPYDIEYDKPFVKGINMSELNRVVSDYYRIAPDRAVLMILDCCHGNSATDGTKSVNSPYESFKDSIEELTKGDGKIVLASTDQEFKAREDEFQHGNEPKHFHGIFTYNLLQGLNGDAIDAADEVDGIITIERLRKYLNAKMQGKQKVSVSTEGDLRLDNIEIAIAPKRYENYLSRLVQEANGYSLEDIFSIKRSADKINIVIRRQHNNSDAIKVKNSIEQSLKGLNRKITKWVGENEHLEPIPKISFYR